MTQQINLFNSGLKEKRAPLTFERAVLGWCAVAVLTTAVAAYAQVRANTLASEERDVASKLAAAKDETQALGAKAAGRRHDPQVAADLERLEEQVRGRHEVMDLLKKGALGDTKGFSEHLRAFARQSFEGLWLTGLHIGGGGQDVTLEGRALKAEHVPGYLKRLNGEQAMQGHPFSDLVIQLPKPEARDKQPSTPPFVEFRIATKTEEASTPGEATR